MKGFLRSCFILFVLSGTFTACKKNKEDPTPTHTLPIPAPVLTDLSPTNGPEGEAVRIFGTNIKSVTAVAFNGQMATFKLDSANPQHAISIISIVPAGATSGNVTVTTSTGTSNGLAFTVTPMLSTISLLTRRPWHMTAYTVYPAVEYNGGYYTDLFNNSLGTFCGLRDYTCYFSSLGVYKQVSDCFSGVGSATGSWTFNSDSTRLSTVLPDTTWPGTQTRHIITLTPTKLICTGVYVDYTHTSFTYTYSYSNVQ